MAKLLPHPPYLPHLAPSDFLLFPDLRKWLGGRTFASNAAVEQAVDGYFSRLDNIYFSDGLKGSEKQWNRCIELKSDYVEK